MKIRITCSYGLETVLKDEVLNICQITIDKIKTYNGYIDLEGNLNNVYLLNLWSRIADRVMIILDSFKAYDFDDLYDSIHKYKWKDIIDKRSWILVRFPFVKDSKINSAKSSQKIIHKAIMDSIGNLKSSLDRDSNNVFKISTNIVKDNVTILLDTTGEGLHKRGYRTFTNWASLRENLAAGLIYLSKWKKDIPIADLTCGTGTICIEAAMILRNIAPGLNRIFNFERFSWINKKDFDKIRINAFQQKDYSYKTKISGFDINEEIIDISMKNALQAGVIKDINFEKNDCLKKTKPIDEMGKIISNLPYGDKAEINMPVSKFHKELFEKINYSYPKYDYYFLTSHKNIFNKSDIQSSKNRKLYNGGKKVFFYSFF